MATIDRIKQFLENEHESINLLAKKISMPQSSVNQWMLGNRKAPLDFIEAICESYPTISVEWLIRGTGEMYLKPKMNEEEFEEWGNEPMPSIGLEQYKTLLEEMKRIQAKVDNLENKVG